MAKILFASLVGGVAAGGKMAVTWEDCTGTIDETLTDGTFTIQVTASLGIKETYTGKACEAKTFNLPFNLGTVTWDGLDCPVSPGAIVQKVGFTTAAVVPAALAKADMKAVCVTIYLQKESIEAL